MKQTFAEVVAEANGMYDADYVPYLTSIADTLHALKGPVLRGKSIEFRHRLIEGDDGAKELPELLELVEVTWDGAEPGLVWAMLDPPRCVVRIA